MAVLTRRTSGDPNQRLRDRTHAASAEFYLVHVTAVGAAREIIRAGQIETRRCTVFDRHLVYFFAMRPAYKLRGAEDKKSILDYFPFVFLVSTQNLGAPFHVYPFDTGGALAGAFDEGASPSYYLEDYALEETLQAVNDHISWAFGSPADYYDGKLKPDFTKSIPDWDIGPQTFAKISRLASAGSNRPDRRASAIELAFDQHVRLSDVKFAILPYQFLEDPNGKNTEMIEKLTVAGVTWETYQWRPNRAPADFHVEINRLVREHLATCHQL
ncbi:hypothetical protein [Mesorhizobium sp. M1406]|uniref:hypothetical protein n=1 Tax=Mesorhizobium sp. M1406 TaxID=2957099 RepID=UPI00333A400B